MRMSSNIVKCFRSCSMITPSARLNSLQWNDFSEKREKHSMHGKLSCYYQQLTNFFLRSCFCLSVKCFEFNQSHEQKENCYFFDSLKSHKDCRVKSIADIQFEVNITFRWQDHSFQLFSEIKVSGKLGERLWRKLSPNFFSWEWMMRMTPIVDLSFC